MTGGFRLMALSLALALGAAAPARAEDDRTITWSEAHFPPFSIRKGAFKGQGLNDFVREILRRGIAAYDHVDIEAAIPRISTEIKSGANWCWIGAVKTPEREAFAYFSIPYGFVIAQRLVVRAESREAFERNGLPELDRILKTETLRTSALRGRAYNRQIDLLMARHPPRQQHSSIAEALQMVMADRLDYIVEYPVVARFHAMEKGNPDALAALPFREMSDIILASVMCPRTEWGRKVITEINTVIRAERASPAFRAAMERWNDSEGITRIRTLYDPVFLATE